MPKPVSKFLTGGDAFLADCKKISPKLVEEFLETYVDVEITAGECKRCGAHIIENNEVHKKWHRSLSLMIFISSLVVR